MLKHKKGDTSKQEWLTSVALKAFNDDRTVRMSASFSAGTCSCTLKAEENPMSSMIAGADVVPASSTLVLVLLRIAAIACYVAPQRQLLNTSYHACYVLPCNEIPLLIV